MTVRESGVEIAERPRRKRPTGVTVVVVLSVLQALLFLVLGIVAFFTAGEVEVRRALEVDTAASVRALGVVVVAIAVVEIVLAVLLARGSERARSVFGVLNTVHVGTAVYGLVVLRELKFESVWVLALPIAVLWLLYGSDAAAEFFEP